MAAAFNPIVLDSSSPPPRFHPPSITPQSARRRSSIPHSSSSALASPSTFVRPLPSKRLPSGSRAQQIPQDVTTGFASAASLLREGRLDAEVEAGQDGNSSIRPKAATEKAEKPTKVAGKLSRPSKAKQPKATAKDESLPLRSPLQDFSYQDYTVRKERHDAPILESPSMAKDGTKQKYRQPKRSPSEYDFPGEHDAAMPRSEAPAKKPKKQLTKPAPVKKMRKRAAVQEADTETAKPKRARKKLAKSESIILNSDEPDPVQVPDQSERETAILKLDHIRTTVMENSMSLDSPASPQVEEAVQTSVYFADREQSSHEKAGVSPNHAPKSLLHDDLSPPIAPASLPRPGLTPAKDTMEIDTLRPKSSGSERLVESDRPNLSLAEIVNGLGYSNQETKASPERNNAGKALTKRRKIELADAATLPLAQKAAPKLPPAEKPKKIKAPKKKPQTITDLATKAYRPAEVETAETTVSAFFAAQPTNIAQPAGHAESDATIKVKKPRKPRARKLDGNAKTPKPTKPPKPKKTKAGETALMAKLFSPGAARAEETRQGFLFGTSSQLAVDDSPTFIREMQTALHASEILAPGHSDGSPIRRSRIKVASAPDGTNLSVGQAFQDHWCVAARDGQGDLMSAELDFQSNTKRQQPDIVREVVQPFVTTATASDRPIPDNTAIEALLEDSLEQAQYPSVPMRPLQSTDEARQVVDLCDTSPAAAPEPTDPGAASDVSGPEPEGCQTSQFPEVPVRSPSEDVWMLLSSDSPPHNTTVDPPSFANGPIRRAPLLSRSATSPSLGRHVLQTLDANASLLARTSPIRDSKRPSSTSTSLLLESRMNVDNQQAAPVQSKDLIATTMKRRGRPPGKKNSTSTVSPKPRRPKSKISASQPTASAEYMNIDDISDSDSPTTPSPPRRRANSTPPAVKPLELETITFPLLKAEATLATASNSNIKATDDNWPALMADIFPRISAAVKASPPSTDMSHPTWHEKILLYDPIILEDLTAWLNNQGLRLELTRLKPKAKQKGRKKKDAPPDVPEYETVEEELKPWMVQKWCEDRSICCLWKEGVNGGRRNRY